MATSHLCTSVLLVSSTSRTQSFRPHKHGPVWSWQQRAQSALLDWKIDMHTSSNMALKSQLVGSERSRSTAPTLHMSTGRRVMYWTALNCDSGLVASLNSPHLNILQQVNRRWLPTFKRVCPPFRCPTVHGRIDHSLVTWRPVLKDRGALSRTTPPSFCNSLIFSSDRSHSLQDLARIANVDRPDLDVSSTKTLLERTSSLHPEFVSKLPVLLLLHLH